VTNPTRGQVARLARSVIGSYRAQLIDHSAVCSRSTLLLPPPRMVW
jgi:hypothetical protein